MSASWTMIGSGTGLASAVRAELARVPTSNPVMLSPLECTKANYLPSISFWNMEAWSFFFACVHGLRPQHNLTLRGTCWVKSPLYAPLCSSEAINALCVNNFRSILTHILLFSKTLSTAGNVHCAHLQHGDSPNKLAPVSFFLPNAPWCNMGRERMWLQTLSYCLGHN